MRVIGITAAADTVVIEDVIIEDGLSVDTGGGLDNVSLGTVTIRDTIIRSNVAIDGGGISNGSGTLNLDNVTITDNTAGTDGSSQTARGGGIFNDGGTVTITGGSILNNETDTGSGGIGEGGGIFNNGGDVSLSGVTIDNNLAESDGGGDSGGGGIFNNGGTLSIFGTTLSNNTADAATGGDGNGGIGAEAEGGGIFNSGGTIAVTNSTIAGNEARSGDQGDIDGGGIFNLSGSTLTVVNVTIVDNISENGAGLSNQSSGTINLANSVIANNSPGDDVLDIGTTNLNESNFVGDDSLAGAAFGGNPLLAPLGDNGGPTTTGAIRTCSPLINAGNDNFAVDPGPDLLIGGGDDIPLTEDQRGTGFPRMVGPVDIGAFELGAGPRPDLGLGPSLNNPRGFGTIGNTTIRERLRGSVRRQRRESVFVGVKNGGSTFGNLDLRITRARRFNLKVFELGGGGRDNVTGDITDGNGVFRPFAPEQGGIWEAIISVRGNTFRRSNRATERIRFIAGNFDKSATDRGTVVVKGRK